MKNASTFFLAAAALAASMSVQAGGVRAVDVPRITNGGTGFIGVTESANTPRARLESTSDSAVSRVPTRAGEASTMVNGRPNGNPDAPTVSASPMGSTMASPVASTAVMGASTPWMAARHPMWGTPD